MATLIFYNCFVIGNTFLLLLVFNCDCLILFCILMDKTKLILAVKKHSCLWDNGDKNYRDKEKQQEAWTRILEEINPKFPKLNPYEIKTESLMLKGKWLNIKYYYKKSMSEAKKIGHENLLSFLAPTLYGKRLNVEAQKPKIGKAKSSNDENSLELLTPMRVLRNDNFNNVNNNKNANSYNNAESLLNNTEVANNIPIVNRQKITQEEEEDDQKFLLSFRSDIKDMNKDEKLEFKVEMLQLVRKIKNRRSNCSVSSFSDEIRNNYEIKDEFESLIVYPQFSVTEVEMNQNETII